MDAGQPDTPKVLVIRSDALRDRVSAALEAAGVSAAVEQAPSYLSAMGWLTQHQASVVIGPVSAMTGMVGSTARAIRKLSPGIRLIAVARDDERAEAGAAASAGFDHCINERADAGTLVAAIGLPAVMSANQGIAASSVDEHDARVSAADNAARMEAAQQATTVVAQASMWTAIALVLGFVAALIGGIVGKPEPWVVEAAEDANS